MGCFSCLAASPEGHGGNLCTALTLVRKHPSLLSCAAITHIGTVLAVLRHTDRACLDDFLAVAPGNAVSSLFGKAIKGMSRQRLLEALPPLLNNRELHESMAKIFVILDAGCLLELLDAVPAEKLATLLKSDPIKLEAVVRAVDGNSDSIKAVFVPVLQEPQALLEGTLVPLISRLHEPEYLGELVNYVPVRTLLWILRKVEAEKLVAILDAFGPEDFLPNGNMIVLLQKATDDPDLVESKVVPLLQEGCPEKLSPVVRRVAPESLLAILRRVEAADLIRLLEHTNTEIVVSLLNGPLEVAVLHTSSFLADQLRDPTAAAAVERITDGLGSGVAQVKEAINRGKIERGVDHQEAYRFGDFTRGVVADISDKTKPIISRQKEALAEISDTAKDAMARHKEAVAEMSDKAKDALARQKEKAGASLSEMQDAVRRSKEDALRRGKEFGDFTKGLVSGITEQARRASGTSLGQERHAQAEATDHSEDLPSDPLVGHRDSR
mmetsp:Transcript_80946/g.147678  ORF Transcript_80946/g.147678 Transcript_80946/m.147678 type:complete len:496 (-) Transcript_80946:9-1496(-)